MHSMNIGIHPLLSNFGKCYVREAQEFLEELEKRRKTIQRRLTKTKLEPIAPEAERLIERIDRAFAEVTCYREVRVLLGGEAEDDYMSPVAQALLAPLEERENWHDIPDDLLLACQCCLSYVGPHAFRFLIPAYMSAALRGVPFDTFYPGNSMKDMVVRRGQCIVLNEAQRTCISDYLCLEVLFELWPDSRFFMPWEEEEYRAHYAASMSPRQYGEMLIRQFCEREGI